MMGPADSQELAPLPSPPQVRKVAKLEVAQDVLAAIGLVSGIVISGVSLWVLISKYRRKTATAATPPR